MSSCADGWRTRSPGKDRLLGLELWSSEVDVFAYFNNDWEGYAIENALYLKRSLGQEAPADAGLLAFANAAAAQG